MAITIKGVKIVDITINQGGEKVESTYELLSSTDKVLAKQSVGGYHGLEVKMTGATKQKLEDFMQAYCKEVEQTIGIETC